MPAVGIGLVQLLRSIAAAYDACKYEISSEENFLECNRLMTKQETCHD